MPRLPVIDPTTATGRAKELFDGPLKGKHLNIFKGMANSPAALEGYLGLAGALSNGQLSAAEREIIALQVGQANSCDYCVAAHTTIGKLSGLSEPQTVEARRGTMQEAKYNALTRFLGALHEKRGHVSDGDLAAFRSAGYTDGHVAEAIANYALNVYTNYFNHTNDTAVDFPIAPAI